MPVSMWGLDPQGQYFEFASVREGRDFAVDEGAACWGTVDGYPLPIKFYASGAVKHNSRSPWLGRVAP